MQIFLPFHWPTTWPANNCLQIMVCSCAMSFNCAANTILLMRKWTHPCPFLRSRQIASPTWQRAIWQVYSIKNSENTTKATKVAYDVFREYLKEKKLTKSHLFHQKKSWHLLWENSTLKGGKGMSSFTQVSLLGIRFTASQEEHICNEPSIEHSNTQQRVKHFYKCTFKF